MAPLFSGGRLSTGGLNRRQSRAAGGELFDPRFHRGRPNEGWGVALPGVPELPKGLLQILPAAAGTSAHLLAGQFPQPALEEMAPTGTGGHGVQDAPRVAAEPRLNLGSLGGAVGVHHPRQRDFAGKLPRADGAEISTTPGGDAGRSTEQARGPAQAPRRRTRSLFRGVRDQAS